jgi:hypothetical protein
VDALRIPVIGVAGRAILDNLGLIPFPRGYFVDVFMAVFALNIIDEMGACIMLCPFLLMASMAGDRLCMNSSSFCFYMNLDIRDIPVATVAGICSMNGLGKPPLTDFSMAAQTFRVVNTLETIFPTFDDKFPFFQVQKVNCPLGSSGGCCHNIKTERDRG